MWKTKIFKTDEELQKWINRNYNRYQWHQIFVNNAYGVEYKPLIKL